MPLWMRTRAESAATALGLMMASLTPALASEGERVVQRGKASWYGAFHEGRRTASGAHEADFMEPAKRHRGLSEPAAHTRSACQRPAHTPTAESGVSDDVDTPADRVRAGLAELGYLEGQTVSLEARFAHHRPERLPALAAELVATQPDVIHTWSTPAARALSAATSTIPIVAAPIGEWSLAELVGDMVRPTGNITGLTLDNRDQQEKCLQTRLTSPESACSATR